MKANRKFVQADEAVSPVIAVILMVAITVVLAATVFVLVSDIGSQSGRTAPALSLRVDDSLDRLVLDSAAAGADWNRIALRLKAVTLATTIICVGNEESPFQNEDPSGTCPATPGATDDRDLSTSADLEVTAANDPMNAADFLGFCASAAGTTDVTITVLDTTANQAIGDFTFLTISGTC